MRLLLDPIDDHAVTRLHTIKNTAVAVTNHFKLGDSAILLLFYNQNGIFNCKIGISRTFRNSRQEDAHELMVNLLESMHKCCLPSGVSTESQSAYDKSLVHKIFGGRLRSQVCSVHC
jgi:hypothetical protein